MVDVKKGVRTDPTSGDMVSDMEPKQVLSVSEMKMFHVWYTDTQGMPQAEIVVQTPDNLWVIPNPKTALPLKAPATWFAKEFKKALEKK